jgi:hypothetical protein
MLGASYVSSSSGDLASFIAVVPPSAGLPSLIPALGFDFDPGIGDGEFLCYFCDAVFSK